MSIKHQHYLVGYGSLLSHDSRSRHSNIFCPNMPIVAHGWQREWLARGMAHLQTALGVSQVESRNVKVVNRFMRDFQVTDEFNIVFSESESEYGDEDGKEEEKNSEQADMP